MTTVGLVARRTVRGAWEGGACERCKCSAQLRDSFAGTCRHLQDRSTFEERAGHELLNLEPHDVPHSRLGEIAFREDHEPRRDVQQPADLEVLPGLWHDRFVGGHVQHHEIHPAHAGKHVPDEALVTGNVHERKDDVLFRGVREAKIDRDAAFFFLAEAIGIGAGQRHDQRALAVIDVTGGADDNMTHQVENPQRTLSSRGAHLRHFGLFGFAEDLGSTKTMRAPGSSVCLGSSHQQPHASHLK
jgi:hypothetical protein